MNRSAQLRWSMPADAAGPVNGPVTPIVAVLHDGPAATIAVLPVFATATDVAAAAIPSTSITPRISRSFSMPSSLLVSSRPLGYDGTRRRLSPAASRTATQDYPRSRRTGSSSESRRLRPGRQARSVEAERRHPAAGGGELVETNRAPVPEAPHVRERDVEGGAGLLPAAGVAADDHDVVAAAEELGRRGVEVLPPFLVQRVEDRGADVRETLVDAAVGEALRLVPLDVVVHHREGAVEVSPAERLVRALRDLDVVHAAILRLVAVALGEEALGVACVHLCRREIEAERVGDAVDQVEAGADRERVLDRSVA